MSEKPVVKPEMKDVTLEIAQLIGSPINTQLPVPVELSAIADTFTAEPGEKVYRFQNLDKTADVVLDVDTDGIITVKKRSLLGSVELTFKGLNSKLDFVLVEDVLNQADTRVLAGRKEAITRGMDKKELKLIIDALLTPHADYFPANQVDANEIEPATGDDLYDVIMKMKHVIEDYGDNYVLVCGSSVKEEIDNYDKKQSTTLHYNVDLVGRLAKMGITVMKVFGKVSVADNEAEVSLMDAKKMILIAQNSRIADGKPVKFVRRKVSPEIAQLMGADVDNTQRALIVNPTPVIDAGENKLAYGIYGYESVIFCVTNPYAISIADVSSII